VFAVKECVNTNYRQCQILLMKRFIHFSFKEGFKHYADPFMPVLGNTIITGLIDSRKVYFTKICNKRSLRIQTLILYRFCIKYQKLESYSEI